MAKTDDTSAAVNSEGTVDTSGNSVAESDSTKTEEAPNAATSTESKSNAFDLETLCSNSEVLFGCHREVVLGAVEALGDKREKFSKAEIKAAIENFKKKEVK